VIGDGEGEGEGEGGKVKGEGGRYDPPIFGNWVGEGSCPPMEPPR